MMSANKKIKNLVVVTDLKTSDFNNKCNKLLDAGYQPSSEFTTFTEGQEVYLCQQFAMFVENDVGKERKEI